MGPGSREFTDQPVIMPPIRPLFPVLIVFAAAAGTAFAQIEFEREPINYATAVSNDRIARLARAIEQGEASLEYESGRGYLGSLLEALEVPVSSQMLVFSKTSFQLRRISPSRPRAVYYNDDTYVGWVQGGEVVELASVDPHLGAVFYMLPQNDEEPLKIVRDRGECLTCHASSRTKGVPGVLVRSVFSDSRGQPMIGSGTFTTDHGSPFSERWGGWYVTGTHGKMRHMGNVTAGNRGSPEEIDREAGANVAQLDDLIRTEPYLAATSDLVALMVVEHQVQMQNLLTLANFETRHAEHYDEIMNAALDRPAGHRSETTGRRIASVGDKLLKYLLFADEFKLEAPVSGASAFVDDFSARAIRDSKGRSLRDLDLQTRLLRYPCSYLIHSESFDALPEPVMEYVVARLHGVLTGTDADEAFDHLSAEDRQAILEVLTETKPQLWASLPGKAGS